MLLKVGKCINRGICHAIHRYAKANNTCSAWKTMVQIKNRHISSTGT